MLWKGAYLINEQNGMIDMIREYQNHKLSRAQQVARERCVEFSIDIEQNKTAIAAFFFKYTVFQDSEIVAVNKIWWINQLLNL